MFSGTYALLMAEYNAWMNAKLYAGCQRLTDEARKQDRGAFFKSIHSTLNHVVWGDRAWLGRFNGKSYALGPLGKDLYSDFDELAVARRELDDEISEWARGVTSTWLAEPMTWTSRAYGFTQTAPRWVLVVQLFNHQTHHRGQAHTLLTQLGVDIGVTDVPLLPILQE